MLSIRCLLLAYSAYAVPMQLSFWDREDPCNPFPTRYIDIFVDTFFIVRACEMLRDAACLRDAARCCVLESMLRDAERCCVLARCCEMLRA
jgi:hypothetical protein